MIFSFLSNYFNTFSLATFRSYYNKSSLALHINCACGLFIFQKDASCFYQNNIIKEVIGKFSVKFFNLNP